MHQSEMRRVAVVAVRARAVPASRRMRVSSLLESIVTMARWMLGWVCCRCCGREGSRGGSLAF
jgi:hypothetical protein